MKSTLLTDATHAGHAGKKLQSLDKLLKLYGAVYDVPRTHAGENLQSPGKLYNEVYDAALLCKHWQSLQYLSTKWATSLGVHALEEHSCTWGHSMLVTRSPILLCACPCKQPWQYRCFPLGQHVACASVRGRMVSDPSMTPPHVNSSQQTEHLADLSANACNPQRY